jgi:hypothetical protein
MSVAQRILQPWYRFLILPIALVDCILSVQSYLVCVRSLCVFTTGEAETKPLSSLAQALGGEPQCAFYGITEVAHSDLVFQNVSAPASDMSIVCDAGSGELLHEHIMCWRTL